MIAQRLLAPSALTLCIAALAGSQATNQLNGPSDGPFVKALHAVGQPLSKAKQYWLALGLKEKKGWYGNGDVWITSEHDPVDYIQLSVTKSKPLAPRYFGFFNANVQRFGSSWSALVTLTDKKIVLNLGDPNDPNASRALMGFAAMAQSNIDDLVKPTPALEPLSMDKLSKMLAGDYVLAHRCFGSLDDVYCFEDTMTWAVRFNDSRRPRYSVYLSGTKSFRLLAINFRGDLPGSLSAAGQILGLKLPDGVAKHEAEDEEHPDQHATRVVASGLKIVATGSSASRIERIDISPAQT